MISVLILTTLCLFKLPVLAALIIAAITAGTVAGQPITETMSTFVNGMGGNSNTALSYILLGALAYTINMTGASDILAKKIGTMIKGNKFALVGIIILVSIAAGTIIPVHIAFIPILIPPLLSMMNEMKMDRRMLSVGFGFGLKATYLTLPIAYGAMYHGLIKDSIGAAGLEIEASLIWKTNWRAGLVMFIGLILGVIFFSKDRTYDESKKIDNQNSDSEIDLTIKKEHWLTLVAGIVTLVVQIITNSLPLGAFAALTFLVITKVIKWNQIEEVLNGGINLMGFIAFVMLVASGYANVIIESGAVNELVDTALGVLNDSMLAGSFMMMVLGLVVVLGIGTSFGTVPILSAVYVPLALELGFSPKAIVLMVSIASAIGDAGSPASDTTLGPTSGLNADGQHNHIWDTCVPQFMFFMIPLFIAGTFWPLFL